MTEFSHSGIEKMQEKQKLRNDRSKYWASVIGQNLSLAVCFMIPVFLIAVIWTETTLPTLGASLATETFLTAAIFVFAEWSAMNVGEPSGRLDDAYLAIQKTFETRRAQIKARGTLRMGVFCEWQIDEELVEARKTLCRRYKIDYSRYKSELHTMPYEQIVEKYGRSRAKQIKEIRSLEPIELSPELILGERRDGLRGGISISAEDYIEKQKYGWMNLIKSILTIILTVGIGFAFSPGVSFGKIVYTVYRLIAVLIRMKTGFDKGAKAYNTVEVKHRESQVFYMDKYDEFLDTPGLYEAAVEKYGATLVPIESKERDRENEAEGTHDDSRGDTESGRERIAQRAGDTLALSAAP